MVIQKHRKIKTGQLWVVKPSNIVTKDRQPPINFTAISYLKNANDAYISTNEWECYRMYNRLATGTLLHIVKYDFNYKSTEGEKRFLAVADGQICMIYEEQLRNKCKFVCDGNK